MFSQTKQDKKRDKKAQKEIEYIAIKELIDSKSYEFEASWANAQRGARVSLIGRSNYLRIKGDSIYTNLSYFGARNGTSGYTDSGGIEINSVFDSYKVEHNDKKAKTIIKISVKNSSESFDLILAVYGGGNGVVTILGSTRSNISYEGEFSEIDKE